MKQRTRGKGDGADEVDLRVGQRLRELRILAGLSQSDLAATIGLTFQQLQKYEKGINRISASKVYLLTRHLNVPVATLFGGLDASPISGGADVDKVLGAPEGASDEDLLRSREGVALARNFMAIQNVEARAAIKAFAEACAGITAPQSSPVGLDVEVPGAPTSVGGRRARRPRGVVWHPTDIARS